MPSTDTRTANAARQGILDASDTFAHRHLGPSEADVADMLETLGLDSLEALVEQVIPDAIRREDAMPLEGLPGSGDAALGELEALTRLKSVADRNVSKRSCIGMGYHGTITPGVILRNVLENPGWYTQYTPYQAEIAQGRLEALLNFQTMVTDLTGLPLSGASLLDEATAAAEAMAMCHGIARGKKGKFIVADDVHPQTMGVMTTRADSIGIELQIEPSADLLAGSVSFEGCSGVLVQYPTTDGKVLDYADLCEKAHEQDALVVCAADLLSLTLLTPPGEFGADVAVGSTQRFGMPMGGGGPHAAYLSTHEKYARKLPGRLVGVSKDKHGDRALRLAIQTREQHIKRDRATSNICTAQVLPAVVASFYAVYHGPSGLTRIAQRVFTYATVLRQMLGEAKHDTGCFPHFDTLAIKPAPGSKGLDTAKVIADACERGINLRDLGDGRVGIALDETTTRQDVLDILAAFGVEDVDADQLDAAAAKAEREPAEPVRRQSGFLTQPVFNKYHNEHDMLRYLKTLENRDLSLVHSMIPLGSCTMKLNASSEMIPITWPGFANIHPFAPADQQGGNLKLAEELSSWLESITGLPVVSLQPNAGSQGEYAGLLAIRRYHQANGDDQRLTCLIPTSAHGTNPASAVIAGFKVVPVKCDDRGDIDLDDLKEKCEKHADTLGALMITYPSTHGVYERPIRDICQAVHDHGGQVYMDGANMNAQVGLTSPAQIGADVCHLNLHKTFCIPHGGGGPGMGPIAAAAHLEPYMPGDPCGGSGLKTGDSSQNVAGYDAAGFGHPVSAAPLGSTAILPISWVYIALMGSAGLTRATEIAILSANYMAKKLEPHFNVLYKGDTGYVAHEFILDCRGFEKQAHITVEDIAKRLIDFGFHAPTMSWPVSGTLMVEPTESEPRAELDRFCDALIAIRQEIADVEAGRLDAQDNPLKQAPHTMAEVSADAWDHPYTRKQAAYPADWLTERKFWPHVARIDNPYGDRNLVCTCDPMESYAE